jgi:hypothetical protein
MDFVVGPPQAWLEIAGWASAADHTTPGTIAVPMADGATESRLSGLRELRITFSRAVDPATVVAGAVTIVGAARGDQSALIQTQTLDAGGTVLTVSLLAAAPDADVYTVTVTHLLRDLDGGSVTGDADVSIRCLAGDVDGSGRVTEADVVAVRNGAGATVGAGNAMLDVTCSGGITSADMLGVRSRVGAALP